MSGMAENGAERLAHWQARIGLSAPPEPSAAWLAMAQRAQRMAIGFESLDVTLGRTIAIDSDSVFAKLVTGGRGGYCFEHNRLFADMLALAGFPVRMLMARVRLGLPEGEVPPRTHVLVLAEIGGQPWIADAGFGAAYVAPLPLLDGAEASTPDGARHRLRRIGERGSLAGEWLLERAGPVGFGMAADEAWRVHHTFDLSEVAQADLEQANHWTNTRPGTRFTSAVLVSIVLEEGFAALSGRRLTIHHGGRADAMEIGSAADYRGMLADLFRIELSLGEVERLGLF